ncbi:MAG TPA: ABC transporter substrate-binding protein [Pyrinomonadaceae bacterium]|nr:ABC transporter substrate-binding protein [Pyrinomonadaceae bacterium]
MKTLRCLVWSGFFCLMVFALAFSSCRNGRQSTFKIGAILPLSGQPAQYGKWIQEGLELAKEEINVKGGINGRPLEIIYEDDQANPKLAASAMQKLANVDKVPVVFGSWSSSSVLAQAPIAEASHVIIMAEAVSPKIRDAGDYTFRIQPDGSLYMKALAPYAYDDLKLRKIATLYVNNDFGVDLAAVFKREFTALGGSIVSENGFQQGQTDLRTQITLAAQSKPDAIFVPAYTEIGQILKQSREMGLNQRFLAAATFENPDILQIARDTANGVYYPHHFDPASTDPRVQEYQKKYTQRFGHPSEGFAVLAYDGLKIIEGALTKCGNDTSCIKSYLYATHDYQGVTGTTSFDEKGDVVKPILIKTVQSGAFVRAPAKAMSATAK